MDSLGLADHARKPTPDWQGATKVHDWRNYISDELRAFWPHLGPIARELVASNAQDIADREEWE